MNALSDFLPHPDPDLYLSNRRICVETIRYLGLDFGSPLTWVAHLCSVKTACQKALSLLRILASSWGADKDTLLLQRTLVLSKLEYGCEIYFSATEARLCIRDSVHHAGVHLATGASPIFSNSYPPY